MWVRTCKGRVSNSRQGSSKSGGGCQEYGDGLSQRPEILHPSKRKKSQWDRNRLTDRNEKKNPNPQPLQTSRRVERSCAYNSMRTRMKRNVCVCVCMRVHENELVHTFQRPRPQPPSVKVAPAPACARERHKTARARCKRSPLNCMPPE